MNEGLIYAARDIANALDKPDRSEVTGARAHGPFIVVALSNGLEVVLEVRSLGRPVE